ncbi:MAG: oxygenase MpaB family protein [Nitritalea sp.]
MSTYKNYTDARLQEARQQGDPLADAAVEALLAQPACIEEINAANSWWETAPPHWPEPLKALHTAFRERPFPLEEAAIREAQAFFYRQHAWYLSLLGLYSLPYCYAFADGAQVLVRSKRITEDIGTRLTETALFVLNSFKPGSFLEDQEVLLTLWRVRLIHAFSRYFIRRYARDWQPEWGTPINQEDLIGTNLAFSLIVVRGMVKVGEHPGEKTYRALLHYWKVIGYYLGLDVETYWSEDPKEMFQLEKRIRQRNLRASAAGKVLMDALQGYYRTQFQDATLLALSQQLLRFFMGEEAADAVGLPKTGQLPATAYKAALQLNFIREGHSFSGYEALRRDFLRQSRKRLGQEVALRLPMPVH